MTTDVIDMETNNKQTQIATFERLKKTEKKDLMRGKGRHELIGTLQNASR